MSSGPVPLWTTGDSRDIAALARGVGADLIFSCPPYSTLAACPDEPVDLSTLGRDAAFVAYAAIIRDSVARLRDDRVAVRVIGVVRNAGGYFASLPGRTVGAFEAAAARFCNDAVLVTAVGSLPIRVGRQFTASRRLGPTHRNVLVPCKGDPKRATEACRQVAFGEIEQEAGEEDEAE